MGTSIAMPSSSEKGRTLHFRPDDSNTKASLPSTTMLACESTSVLGLEVDFSSGIDVSMSALRVCAFTAFITAFTRCVLGVVTDPS